MKLGAGGSATFPLLVIFGVLLAFLMTFVFVSIYEQQLVALVDEEAEALADGLARAAFESFVSGELVEEPLPTSLGGSFYTIQIEDNDTFVIEITAGRKAGSTYTSISRVALLVENSAFSPGGRIYFLRRGDILTVSSSEIEEPAAEVLITPVTTPPSFYHFAKTEENVREAVGIAAVYFSYKSEHPGSRADVTSYKWEDGKLLVQVAEDGHPLLGFAVQFSENLSAVGRIQRAVVVDGVRPAENIEAGERCPSIENAYLSGWFYSPDMVLDHLRSRTWWRSADNLMISVPADASVSAAAATTNVSTYPTWRVTFDNQVIFYRAMPWWELENVPGFLFQSDPELHPVI